MVKAYSYIRFSRPEQLRGDSLRRQTEAANKWAAECGVVIDESLRDLGVSAFKGANRIKGALGRFHDLVEKGQVPRGSYLIVESLDRISRKAIREVLPDFLQLINAGIVIVTLQDNKREISAQKIDDDPMALLASLLVMQRAHEESKTKAVRLGEVWGKKRANAQATTQVMSARVPAWLRVVGSGEDRRIEFIPATPDRPDGRDLVRGIFLAAIRGDGRRSIAARLNDAKVPALEDGKEWHASYILKILQNRATYGEHQAYRRDDAGRRIAAGPPIPGYYPAAVTEAAFLKANATRKSRAKGAAGRRGPTGAVNLVKGMAFCACGGKMARLYKGPAPKGAAYLVCAEAKRGACEIDRRWRLDFVEERILVGTSRVDIGSQAVLSRAVQDALPHPGGTHVGLAPDRLQPRAHELRPGRQRLVGMAAGAGEGRRALGLVEGRRRDDPRPGGPRSRPGPARPPALRRDRRGRGPGLFYLAESAGDEMALDENGKTLLLPEPAAPEHHVATLLSGRLKATNGLRPVKGGTEWI